MISAGRMTDIDRLESLSFFRQSSACEI